MGATLALDEKVSKPYAGRCLKKGTLAGDKKTARGRLLRRGGFVVGRPESGYFAHFIHALFSLFSFLLVVAHHLFQSFRNEALQDVPH